MVLWQGCGGEEQTAPRGEAGRRGGGRGGGREARTGVQETRHTDRQTDRDRETEGVDRSRTEGKLTPRQVVFKGALMLVTSSASSEQVKRNFTGRDDAMQIFISEFFRSPNVLGKIFKSVRDLGHPRDAQQDGTDAADESVSVSRLDHHDLVAEVQEPPRRSDEHCKERKRAHAYQRGQLWTARTWLAAMT
eukprot:766573-Hanusia_phi.AAC.1